jgi:hypothetical protein
VLSNFKWYRKWRGGVWRKVIVVEVNTFDGFFCNRNVGQRWVNRSERKLVMKHGHGVCERVVTVEDYTAKGAP